MPSFQRPLLHVLAILWLPCVVAQQAPAATWYLSPTGNDATGDGSLVKPWFELEVAVPRAQVQSGDTIILLDGLYNHAADKQSITRRFDTANPLVIQAANRHQAILQFDGDPPGGNTDIEGVGVHGAAGIVFDGLEIRGGGDNTLHIGTNCSYITVRHCVVHEAGSDGDSIKINGCDHITVDSCVVYDPGRRRGSLAWTWQENIDFVACTDSVVRNCLLYHTARGGDTMLYAKMECFRIVFENNVIVDQYAGAFFPPVTLGGTLHSEPAQLIDDGMVGDDGPPPSPDPNTYSCTDITFRNNIVARATHGSIGLFTVRDAWVVNNVFVDCDGGGVWVLSEDNTHRTSRDCYVHNNIFYDSRGAMQGLYRRGKTASGLPMILYSFNASHNLFWNAGQPIPATGFLDPNAEAGAVFADPRMVNPTVSGMDRAAIIAGAALQDISPAINAALALPSRVPIDVLGEPRPIGAAPDIGVHEFFLPGDADRDGDVDIFDVIDVVGAFGSVPGDPNWIPGADFDRDGQITVFDVTDAVTNFGRVL